MSMENVSKLSFDEMHFIVLWNRQEYPVILIARTLGRHRSSIYRFNNNYEALIKEHPDLRNEDSFVVSRLLYDLALERRSKASSLRMRLKNEVIQKYVEEWLKKGRSVLTIAGRISLDIAGARISHEAIYQWVNEEKPELKSYLPLAGKYQRRRVSKRTRQPRPVYEPKKSIEARPEEANNRSRIGDYELDAIVSCRGSKSALQVLVDRRLRKVFLKKVPCLEAEIYKEALIEQLKKAPHSFHTITSDNGVEHAEFHAIESKYNIQWFFCHPYCASERGTVENRNRFIRKYFPKGTNFDDIPDEFVQWVEDYINNYPLGVLGFRTPNEAWEQSLLAA